MSAPHLLITGFGPFPSMPVNPSALLAKRVAASPRLRRSLGVEPQLLILRTAYAAMSEQLEPALAAKPNAVLMIGVAARTKRVRVETRACNRASRLFPDASGILADRLSLDPAGPFLRHSPSAPRALAALRGIDAGASRDAGRYLCNASYYRVLSEGCPAVFLHIPPPARTLRPMGHGRGRHRRPLDAWTDAFVAVALALVSRARNTTDPAGRVDTKREG